MAKMGNIAMPDTVDSVETAPLADDLFAPPAGYKTASEAESSRASRVTNLPRSLLARRAPTSVVAVELRPPRAELESAEGMDAWIDTYHAMRRWRARTCA